MYRRPGDDVTVYPACKSMNKIIEVADEKLGLSYIFDECIIRPREGLELLLAHHVLRF